ncbi:hypothetical protein RvY_04848 [Ramazzottius varieornatus]|uniref:Major facilitator superfamily (MFS) profile domain-containing protein n=1 Tax=Ramazzottius varieornatus TaxID=947166 RepID=A0A1D1UWI9_RAMVA|nr:hypothetical protein RvY_04848 [Ramazzottius varieornatus]
MVVTFPTTSRTSRYEAARARRARANSADSTVTTTDSWDIPTEHETAKSLVDYSDRPAFADDLMENASLMPFPLRRSFSFQGSSGLRSRYLATMKPHIYRHPEDQWEVESLSFRKLSSHQKRTLSLIWLAKISYYFALGMMPIVLPSALEAQGFSTLATGTIFAIWGLTTVITWPLWQMAVPRLGTKNTFNLGLFLTGTSFVLFGSLHWEQDALRYIILAAVFRAVEGIGFAALEVAITAKLLVEFPRNESGVYGSALNCVGVGLTLGSCLAGALYYVADVAATFLTCGLLLFVVGFVSICFLERRPFTWSLFSDSTKKRRKFRRNISLYGATTMFFFAVLALAALQTIIEPHIRTIFGSHYTVEGIILALIPLSFSFGVALWQWLITHDFICGLECSNITGIFLAGFIFLFTGPVKAFNIPANLLWLDLLCFLGLGGTASMVFAATFHTFLECAEAKKLNKLAAYSTTTSVIVITQALGTIVGAPLGGFLNWYLDFQLATAIIASILFGACLIGAIFSVVRVVVKMRRLKRMAGHHLARIERAKRSGRSSRAQLVGGSLARKTTAALQNIRINNFRYSANVGQFIADDHPLLEHSVSQKHRSYGTYL